MADQPLITPQKENNEKIQPYMSPHNVNPSLLNNVTPDQAYNSIDMINKPKYPLQDLNVSMNQSQDSAPPAQEILPINNYFPQTSITNDTPYIAQSKYQNYKNISEIPHKGISQIDNNTFSIYIGYFLKIFPSTFFIIGVGFLVICFLIWINKNNSHYLFLIVGVIFIFIGLVLFLKNYNTLYFIIGPNTLTITKKSKCREEKKIYNDGELVMVDFHYDYSYDLKNKRFMYHYNLTILPTKGKQYTIFSLVSKEIIFTEEEVKFFSFYINTHIQTKMRTI